MNVIRRRMERDPWSRAEQLAMAHAYRRFNPTHVRRPAVARDRRTPDWELEMGDGRTVGIEVYRRSECASGCIRRCGDHTFDDEGRQTGYLFSGLGPDSQRLRNVLHNAADRKGGPRSQLSGYDIKVLVVGLVDQRAGYEFTTCMRYPSPWGRGHLGFLNDVATEVMDFVNNMDSASNIDEIWAFDANSPMRQRDVLAAGDRLVWLRLTTAGASLYTALDQYTFHDWDTARRKTRQTGLHIKRCVAPAPLSSKNRNDHKYRTPLGVPQRRGPPLPTTANSQVTGCGRRQPRWWSPTFSTTLHRESTRTQPPEHPPTWHRTERHHPSHVRSRRVG